MKIKKLFPAIFIFLFDLLIISLVFSTIFYLHQENNTLIKELSQQKNKEVEKSAQQKYKETSLVIKEKMMNYLSIPPRVNQRNDAALREEYLTDIATHREYFEKQLVSQLIDFPMVSQSYFANQKGEFIDVIRKGEEIYIAYKASSKSPAQYYLWDNEKKKRGKEEIKLDSSFKKLPEDYDPIVRPWYKGGKVKWSRPYDDYHSNELVVSAIHPVNRDNQEPKMHSVNKNPELIGVFGCEFWFTDTKNKLKLIQKTSNLPQESILLLIDNKEKNLLSINTDIAISSNDKDKTIPVKLKNVGSSLLKEVAKKLEEKEISKEEITDFFYKKGFLIQIIAISDDFGLDWSLIVLTPKDSFVKHVKVDSHNNERLQLIYLVILIALIMWLTSILLKRKYLSRWS